MFATPADPKQAVASSDKRLAVTEALANAYGYLGPRPVEPPSPRIVSPRSVSTQGPTTQLQEDDATASPKRNVTLLPAVSKFFADPSPARDYGWFDQQRIEAQNEYERATSLGRLQAHASRQNIKSERRPRPPPAPLPDLDDAPRVLAQQQRAAIKAEGERLASLLHKVPRARAEQHLSSRQLPVGFKHFTTSRGRSRGTMRVHRNLLLPLDCDFQPDHKKPVADWSTSTLEHRAPLLVPREWKLAQEVEAARQQQQQPVFFNDGEKLKLSPPKKRQGSLRSIKSTPALPFAHTSVRTGTAPLPAPAPSSAWLSEA